METMGIHAWNKEGRPSGPLAELLWAVGLSGLLFLVIQAVSVTGKTFLPERRVQSVAGPLGAYERWKAAGVRGRIGVFFDPGFSMEATLFQSFRLRQAAAERLPIMPNPDNAFCLAISEGILREVRVVVPDADWADLRARWSKFSFTACDDARCRFTVEGVPVTVQGMAAFRPPGERALMYASEASAIRYGTGGPYPGALSDPALSDLVLVAGETSGGSR